MFLNLLDPDQQRLFVVAARMVAEQDGKVIDVEQSLLDAVIAECELDEDPGAMPMPDLLAVLDDALADDPYARNVFVLELAGVAVVDGDVQPAELAALGEISDHVGVTADRLSDFVQFAMAARELVVRGRQLVATGNAP